MASVNYLKLKGASEVKAQLRHSATDTRLKTRHSNPDIDLSKTMSNITLLGDYGDACKRYDARIKELDSSTNTNKRKDRVTAFALNIPEPLGLSEEESAKFFWDVIGVIGTTHQITPNDVIAAWIHNDEKHDYIVNSDSEEHGGELARSRSHLHLFVMPVSKDGKLNAKAFSSREMMKEVNHAIDLLARKKYGVQFLTGEKALKRSVEELKRISATEMSRAEQKLAETIRASHDEEEKYHTLKTINEEQTERMIKLKSKIEDTEKKQLELQEKEAELEIREAEVADREQRLETHEYKLRITAQHIVDGLKKRLLAVFEDLASIDYRGRTYELLLQFFKSKFYAPMARRLDDIDSELDKEIKLMDSGCSSTEISSVIDETLKLIRKDDDRPEMELEIDGDDEPCR